MVDLIVLIAIIGSPSLFIFGYYRQRAVNRLYKMEITLYSLNLIILLVLTIPRFIKTPWQYLTKGFSEIEIAYFEGRYKDVIDLFEKEGNLGDLKANKYFISSDYQLDDKIEEDTRSYYRNLLLENPEDPKAHLYLSMLYRYDERCLEESDSAYLLMNRALFLGLDLKDAAENLRFLYADLGHRDKEIALVPYLLNSNDPHLMRQASYTIAQELKDTLRAIEVLRSSLEIMPQHVTNIGVLSQFYIESKDFEKADKLLTEALEVNGKADFLISRLAILKERKGDFEGAKKTIEKALESGTENGLHLTEQLLYLYFTQDSIARAFDILGEARRSFEDYENWYYWEQQLNLRKKWMEDEVNIARKAQVEWLDSYEEAFKQSSIENKPILVDFYTNWCYWCEVLDKKVYPDSLVEEVLKQFILLKVNAEKEVEFAERYNVASFPTLLLLDEKGEEFYEIDDYITPKNLINELHDGLKDFEEILLAQQFTETEITTANNIRDALLLSSTKDLPIIVYVTDERSDYSTTFLEKTVGNKEVLYNLSKFVNVHFKRTEDYVDDDLIMPTSFPSVYFLDGKKNILYQRNGNIPPQEFIDLLKKVSSDFRDQQQIDQINWFYNLEEAKAAALVSKKNIFIASNDPACDPCNQMKINVYENPMIVETMNESYVPVLLDIKRDQAVIEMLDLDAFPGQLITDESGKEIIGSSGYKGVEDLLEWLDLQPKMRLLSVLGAEKYHAYNLQKKYATLLSEDGYYHSAIEEYLKIIEMLPEDHEAYYDMALACKELNADVRALEALKTSVRKGRELDEQLFQHLIILYYRLGQPSAYVTYIDQLSERKASAGDQAKLLWANGLFFYLNENYDQALEYAEKSLGKEVTYQALNLKGILLYEKGEYKASDETLKDSQLLDKRNPIAPFYRGLIATIFNESEASKAHLDEVYDRVRFPEDEISMGFLESIAPLRNYPAIQRLRRTKIERAIILDPENIFYRFKYVLNDLLNQQVTDSSLINFEKVVELGGDMKGYHWMKGWILLTIDEEKGIQVIEKLLEETPADILNEEIFMITVLSQYYLKTNNQLMFDEYKHRVIHFRSTIPPHQDIYNVQHFKDLLERQYYVRIASL